MDTNRVPQPRHDDDSVERTTPASSAPTPAWRAGCSLAALSSPSTTLMARSSSTSACRAAAARIAGSPTPIAHAATTRPESPDRPDALFTLLAFLSVFEPVLVLLAVGHGGSFEGGSFLLQLLVGDAEVSTAEVSTAEVGVAQVGVAQVGVF